MPACYDGVECRAPPLPSRVVPVSSGRWTKGARVGKDGVADDFVPPPTYFEAPPGSQVVPREVLTPVHHFIRGTRRTAWTSNCAALPPRIYVDHVSLIREVSDVTVLRRGDHCMVSLNVLRCLNPRVDYFVSLLGSLELLHLWHHFIVLDDVTGVDKNGVPLTSTGEIASIMEYSNTIPEFLEEVRVAAAGRWYLFPIKTARTFMRKARCHRVALGDYGDMPHIFRVERKMCENERERVVQEAEKMLIHHPKYHIFFANCEHTTNMVTKRQFKSPEIKFVVWSLFRYLLTLVGLFFFHAVVVRCYSHYCLQYPVWALAAYYLFTAVPVFLQSLIQFGMLVATVRSSYHQNMISRDDFYHLLVKEVCRAVIAGGLAVFVLAFAPHAVRSARGGYTFLVSFFVVFAYMISDMLFGLLSQLVVRILVRVHGRFWLHGGSPLTKAEEAELVQATAGKKGA